jgi:hypothetical protein
MGERMASAGSKRTVASALLVATTLLAGTVGGCTSATPGKDPTATAPEPAATATRDPAATEPTAQDGGIPASGTEIATGNFTSATGTATGRVSLVTNEGHIDVRFEDFSVEDGPELRVYLIPEHLGPDDPITRPDSIQLELGTLSSPTGSQEYRFGEPWSWGDSDPTFFRTLAVISYPALAEGSEAPATAVAPLTWTFPRPRDVSVADSGTTGGARGEVESDGSVPISYTVAPDDLIAEIAARFGLTVRDLLWLNPVRGKAEAIAGEKLNLSPAFRGVGGAQ